MNNFRVKKKKNKDWHGRNDILDIKSNASEIDKTDFNINVGSEFPE